MRLQRDFWQHAPSIIWAIHSIINCSSLCSSHSAIAFQCFWSSTITVRFASMFLPMKKRCEHRRKKWMLNHCERIQAQQQLKCEYPEQQSQFAFYLLLVIAKFTNIRLANCVQHDKSIFDLFIHIISYWLVWNRPFIRFISFSSHLSVPFTVLTILLLMAAWTPYGTMALIGSFGNKSLLTPGVTMLPACTCKFVACVDPYVYAISHPKYR